MKSGFISNSFDSLLLFDIIETLLYNSWVANICDNVVNGSLFFLSFIISLYILFSISNSGFSSVFRAFSVFSALSERFTLFIFNISKSLIFSFSLLFNLLVKVVLSSSFALGFLSSVFI